MSEGSMGASSLTQRQHTRSPKFRVRNPILITPAQVTNAVGEVRAFETTSESVGVLPGS